MLINLTQDQFDAIYKAYVVFRKLSSSFKEIDENPINIDRVADVLLAILIQDS